MTVLVTGALGRVGTALIDHAGDEFEYVYLDRESHPNVDSVTADIREYAQFEEHVRGTDAVVHLAAASKVDAPWPDVLQSNIIGSYNCLEAATRHGVETVVLASTNHVVGMYENDHAPELYDTTYDLHLDHQTPVRPDSHYASSKVYAESLARYYVENYTYPKRVYVLRIGSVRSAAYDHPYGDAERGVESGEWTRGSPEYRREVNRMKATWLSRRDTASLITACLRDETVTYDIFYGVSNNERRWFDISRAREKLGYDPEDDGETWDAPPEGGKRTDEGSVCGDA